MKDFFKDLWQNHKKDIFQVLVMIILFVWALISMQRCSTMKLNYETSQNNIVALTDSIEYYETKTGELVAQKTMLTGEIKDLKESHSKELNNFYNDLNDMKRKNAQMAAQIKGFIDNPVRDTIFEYSKDTLYISQKIIQPFRFTDDYRKLTGNIVLNENKLRLNIAEDQVFFDYTVAVEDGLIYIKSDNPYVKYNSVTAIAKPEKPKRWCLGVQLGVGVQYDLFSKTFGFGPNLSAGLTYEFYF